MLKVYGFGGLILACTPYHPVKIFPGSHNGDAPHLETNLPVGNACRGA